MKPLPVDLRSRSLPPRWAWSVPAALAIAGLAFAVAAGIGQRKLEGMRADQSAQLRRLELLARVTPPPPAPTRPYDASARSALAQAQAEWPSLLIALEAIEMVGVTPVAVDVSTTDRQVRVELEFTDFASVLRFVDELNSGESSPRWSLVQAQGASRAAGATAATPGVPSVATILANW